MSRQIKISEFPPNLRGLMSLKYGCGFEEYADEFEKLTTHQLQVALKILEEKYPGDQIQKKNRITAEIKRRIRKADRGLPEKAILPRQRHWHEDFEALWEEARRPFLKRKKK